MSPDLAPTLDAEAMRGQRPYLEVLQALHRQLQPELYIEIGVRHGASLGLATGPAVGIDPKNRLTQALPESTVFCEMTSDEYFAEFELARLDNRFDFAFIDGMHLFEFALRDFINVERHATRWTLVVFDDICPNHPRQAARERDTRVWTGDVWKVCDCLRRWRPDLVLLVLDTHPSGLLLVAGLDPSNTVLRDRYEDIVRDYVGNDPPVPAEALDRVGALAPTDQTLRAIGGLIAQARAAGGSGDALADLRRLAER